MNTEQTNLEQLQHDLAEAKMELRQLRAKLDECGVAEVPEHVRLATKKDSWIQILQILIFLAISFLALLTTTNPDLWLLTVACAGAWVGCIVVMMKFRARKFEVPELMVKYNNTKARIEQLIAQICENP